MSSFLSSFSSSLPPISSALHRTKAETIRRHLTADCRLVAGIWCNGLSVRQLQALRAALPPSASLVFAKKTLVAKVVAGTPWASAPSFARGMNAWLFVHGDEDEIRGALKPFRELQKKWGIGFNDYTGAVFEGKVYGPDEFQELESMPTKMETYGYLLGCLQSPAYGLIGALEAAWANKKEQEGDGAAAAEVAATS